MSSREELRHRVEAKRKELEAKLEHFQAEAHRSKDDAARKVREKLDQLSGYLHDGWEKVSEETARKLNQWLH